MKIFDSPTELAGKVGEHLGYSDWLVISQERINQFAEVTGDDQWIHVDVERARREAPGGTTIAHGYLLLSLMGVLQPQIFSVNAKSVLNYGLNRMRFLAPVPAGARVRLGHMVKSAEQVGGGWRIAAEVTLEIEGGTKPAFVAEIVFQYYD